MASVGQLTISQLMSYKEIITVPVNVWKCVSVKKTLVAKNNSEVFSS